MNRELPELKAENRILKTMCLWLMSIIAMFSVVFFIFVFELLKIGA